jgi:hypothetical protein
VLWVATAIGLWAVASIGRVLAGRRSARDKLLDTLDQMPDYINAIYLNASAPQYYRAARQRVNPPEAENMPSGVQLFAIVIRYVERTTGQSQIETVPVRRDQALDLLAWLRSKAPSAAAEPQEESV